MKTILMIAVAAALLQDPPPPAAPPGGRITWGRDLGASERRARLEQRACLVYFTDGGLPCKALDAGAFSADEVVAASRRLFPILLECPDDKAHATLRSRLKVTAFPTVTILEPDGKTATEMLAREPAEVAAELTRVARKFPGREVLWLSTLESALEKAKGEPKPLAIYFHSAEDDLAAAQDRIVKLGGQSRVDKFIWVELTATLEDKDPLKEKYDLVSLPAVGFLDPRPEKPKKIGILEIYAKTKAKDVQEKLENVVKKYKDAKK
jgi:hypothetical protein